MASHHNSQLFAPLVQTVISALKIVSFDRHGPTLCPLPYPLVRNVLSMLGERFAGISAAKTTVAALVNADGMKLAANL